MKKNRLVLSAIFLIAVVISVQQVTAQDKTKEEQEKELKILKEIEVQKRAMSDQKREQENSEKALEEAQFELDEALENIQVEVEVETSDIPGKGIKIYNKRGARTYTFDEPFITVPRTESFYGFSFGDDSERTSWEFSKSLKENTFSSEYTFDVEKTAKSVVMSVMGDCKAGEIRIRIVMPNGKNYSDIVIDEFGNLNWRK